MKLNENAITILTKLLVSVLSLQEAGCRFTALRFLVGFNLFANVENSKLRRSILLTLPGVNIYHSCCQRYHLRWKAVIFMIKLDV